MFFGYSNAVTSEFLERVTCVLTAKRLSGEVDVSTWRARFLKIVQERLAGRSEGELPEIRAWRQAFSKMGLKPTVYGCASEALLRRFRKDESLPQINPLIDLYNAVSLAFATPIAAFDTSKIGDGLEVRHATGAEVYLTFSAEIENPEAGKIVFVDKGGRAHARRWTNRQSAFSAIQSTTTLILIVAKVMHDLALADIRELTTVLVEEIAAIWGAAPDSRILDRTISRCEFET